MKSHLDSLMFCHDKPISYYLNKAALGLCIASALSVLTGEDASTFLPEMQQSARKAGQDSAGHSSAVYMV